MNDKPDVICILCGCVKKYKSKNPYPCPMRKTHEWRFKKKRVNMTAYRKKMGDFDKGTTLKEHSEIDQDRKGDWG